MRDDRRQARCSWAENRRRACAPITTPNGACRCTTTARCSNSSAWKARRPDFAGARCWTSARTIAARSPDSTSQRCARLTDRRIEILLTDAGLIRNRLKITSVRDNARAALAAIDGVRQSRCVDLVVRRRQTDSERMARRQGCSGHDGDFRPHEQGAGQARLPLRRIDDLLRLHAGDRDGQRSSGRLFSVSRKGCVDARCSFALPLAMTDTHSEPHNATSHSMLVTDPADFLAAFTPERFPARAASTARAAFLVSPAASTLASESATDNRYMDLAQSIDPQRALAQHAELARRLGEDVPVITFPAMPNVQTACSRTTCSRPHRDASSSDACATRCGSAKPGARTCADFSATRSAIARSIFRQSPSLPNSPARWSSTAPAASAIAVFPNAAISMARARCTRRSGLRLTFCFELAAGEYHTNVVMALLAGRTALLAADGFRDPAVPEAIAQGLGGRVVWLSRAQKNAFCGNAIALGRRPRLDQRARGASA